MRLPQVLIVSCARHETSACPDGHLVWFPRLYCSAAARAASDSRRSHLVDSQFLFASRDAGGLHILPCRPTTRSTVRVQALSQSLERYRPTSSAKNSALVAIHGPGRWAWVFSCVTVIHESEWKSRLHQEKSAVRGPYSLRARCSWCWALALGWGCRWFRNPRKLSSRSAPTA